MNVQEVLGKRVTDAGGRLTVRSALNPALWMCAIVSGPATGMAVYRGDPAWWLITLILGPVITAMLGFLVLLAVDRDKLQSEDFQIKKRSLELIEQKGMQAPLSVLEAGEVVTPDAARINTVTRQAS